MSAVMKEVEKEISTKTEVEVVKMKDGREVSFAGKRKLIKEPTFDNQNATASVRFDFRNGETRTFTVPDALMAQLAAHGASQKIGDEVAGETDLDDMVIAVDSIIERLNKGEWGATRTTGDGFAGASVVIKAICEVTKKSVEEVKTFLQGKLDAAKERGEKLSRAELYASFRKHGTKTAAIIERLEREKQGSNKVDSDALLNELK